MKLLDLDEFSTICKEIGDLSGVLPDEPRKKLLVQYAKFLLPFYVDFYKEACSTELFKLSWAAYYHIYLNKGDQDSNIDYEDFLSRLTTSILLDEDNASISCTFEFQSYTPQVETILHSIEYGVPDVGAIHQARAAKNKLFALHHFSWLKFLTEYSTEASEHIIRGIFE